MKVILLSVLVISLVSCKKESSSTNSTTSNTPSQSNTIIYSGKKLEIQKEDLPSSPLTYNEAKSEILKIGNNWRLPTDSELAFMYLDRIKIGGFREAYYWGNYTGIYPPYCVYHFKTGNLESSSKLPSSTNTPCYVRLVRTIK